MGFETPKSGQVAHDLPLYTVCGHLHHRYFVVVFAIQDRASSGALGSGELDAK